MTRERSGCWTLTLAVVVALFVGALAGGVAGFGVALWFSPRATIPPPTPTAQIIVVQPSPMPTVESAGVITVYEESATVSVVSKVWPAVVTVVNLGSPQRDFFGNLRQPQSLGSGVVLAPDGYVITNQHVIEGNASLSIITASGEKYEAELVGADDLIDLAVLRVLGNPGLSMVELGDSSALVPGQRVIAIGSALGEFKNTVTAGVVSGLERSIDMGEGFRMEGLIQTDAAINHGNSGGPLVSLQGQVIGINTLIIRGDGTTMTVAEGLGFAIPANTVQIVTAELIQNGYVRRPYLGVSHAELTAGMARYYGLSVTQGTLVVRVPTQSPAAQAGLKPGDVIIAINGVDLDEEHPFLNVLLNYRPGDTVTLRVNRYGEELTLEAVLGESPR
jgi:2-alkenal reductase